MILFSHPDNPKPNPSLKISLADLPRSAHDRAHDRGIHIVHTLHGKTVRRGGLVFPEGRVAATAEATALALGWAAAVLAGG